MPESAEPMVTLRHCVGVDGRAYCAPGIRAFCARFGISLRELARGGVAAGLIEATGDAMALRAASRARAEQQDTP